MWKQKIVNEQNDKIAFNTLRNYTTTYHTYLLLYSKEKIQIHLEYLHYNIYHTYQLLYCKGHIQMISNDSIINVK